MKTFTLTLVLAAAAAAVALPVGAAQIVERSAFNGTSEFGDGVPAMRMRGLSSGGEFYLGVNDLGIGGNRSESNFAYDPSQSFSFSYDRTTGGIAGTLSNPGETDNLTFAGTPGGMFDAVLLIIRGPGRDGALFDVSDLSVNGESVAGQAPGAGYFEYLITGFADLPTLTVTGRLNVTGTLNGNDSERLRVEMKMGTATPVPLPAALPLTAAGLGLLGALSRRRRRHA